MPIAFPKFLHRLSTNVPLSWVLTVPFVLPTIGAVALVGYLFHQSGQATVENMGRKLLAQTNERVTQEVKTYLQTPLLINRLNVDAVNQKQLDLQNVPALESALFNRLQQFERVTAVLFVSPQGKFRVVEQLPKLYLGIADPPQPDKLLIYHLDGQGRRGQLVTTVNGLDVRRDRPWYQRAVRTGKLGWNPISQYGTFKALTLDASQPVYDRTTKRLVGVFAVHIRLDYLSEFLRHLDISRFGQAIIMDQSGALVATSTPEQLYEAEAGIGHQNQFKQLNINESHDNLTRSLGKYLYDRPSTLRSLEQPQDLEFRYKGELQYVKITPFHDPYGLNWRILTVIPKAYFLEPIQHNTRQTILLCQLTLGVAIGLGLLAANRLTAGFAQLNRASRELAAGNLDQRLPTDSPIYELNGLAQTFNQMAEQLQQSFDRIKTTLKGSEEKFTTIFRTSPDPIAIASLAEERLLEVNDSLIEFFGYSHAEMIGCTALELNLWNDLNERDQYRALLQQQKRVRNLEVQIRTQSGEVKTILLSAEIRTLEGQDRLIVMYRDISDRKAVELALQQSEARYRAIVEDQTELIARFLPDTTLLFANAAYCRCFGINQEDVIGKSYSPNIHEADRDQVARIMQSMSIVNPTAIVENRVISNGDIRWMQWVNRMLFDEQGNFTELQAVGRDITKLKQIEEALRKSEANLLQAQQIAQVGSWEIDLETEKITWSEELFHIFGLDPAQLEPSRIELLKIIPDEDRGVLNAAIKRSIAEGTPYEVEHHIHRPDGTICYIISKGQAALNDQQQVYKIYGTALDITERKQAEAALQESETRFRQLAETVREGFFVFETESSHYSYVNPAYEAIIGIPSQAFLREELSSKGMSYWLNNIHPDDRNRIEAGLQRERQGNHFYEEYRFIRPNGEILWLLSQAFPIQDETGTILRIVGTVEDITARKQLEQSLRSQAEAEHLLATITQNIRQSLELEKILATTVLEIQRTLNADRVLIFRLNPDGSGQVIQEAVVPTYPMTDQMRWEDEHFPEECYEYYRQGNPRIVPNVATDEWAGCLTEFLQEVGVKSKVVAPIVQTSGKLSAEVWGLLIVHACSHYRHWQESEADFLQRICNQLAIAIDQANLYQQLQIELAERRQTEKALRVSEEQFRRAFDDAPIGISLISPTGQFLKANTCYCDIIGYTEAELLALTFQELTYPADLEADLAGLRQLVAGEIRSFQMKKRYITKQGTIVPVLLNVAPIRDEDGQLLYLVGHIQDTRDYLKVERMKEEFISVVSHELRTPLTSIRGALGILETGVFNDRPEKAQHMLQIALNNSERLVRLVNDILTLERLESGKVQLVMEHCQVEDLMQQAVDSVQAIADQSAITLCLTPLRANLWAAPDTIIQTFTNLLSNAIKFSSTGNTVWFKAEMMDEQKSSSTTRSPLPTPYILFTIKDQGRGIPQNKLDVIFEQFQQVDVSDSRQKGGTGLGLAICKKIVQQHGGQIWVESRLGEGSTFYFTLPLTMKNESN